MKKYGISPQYLADFFRCSKTQVYHYMSGRSSLINGARISQLKEVFYKVPDILKALNEHTVTKDSEG